MKEIILKDGEKLKVKGRKDIFVILECVNGEIWNCTSANRNEDKVD